MVGFAICIGTALGAVFGAVAGELAVWTALGIGIGTITGAFLDANRTVDWDARRRDHGDGS